jgi:hypothetical protein
VRRRSAVGLALAVAAAVVLPSGVSSTVAAWNDTEWTSGTVGTSSFDCGVDTGYSVTAESAFLRGSLFGQDLGAVAELEPLVLERSGDDPVEVSPPTAVDLGAGDGDPGRDTRGQPIAVSALGLVGLDLTGFQVGLPATSAGAVNQFARVTTTGTSTAASGLVDNGGGLLVSDDTPQDALPEPARLSLGGILPGISGVADAGLEVGAVGSRAELDWCAAAYSDAWGDGSETGLARDYGIASLDLGFDSAGVEGLTGEVVDTVDVLDAAVGQLAGQNGLVSQALRESLVNGLVSGLSLGSLTGSVTITGLDLSGAVAALLTEPISDGEITIDPVTGEVFVDLASLLGDDTGGVNDLDPNTELVVDSDVINDLTARTGTLLDGWTSAVTAALDAELAGARVVVDLSTVVSLGSTQILRVNLDLDSTVGELEAGEAVLAVDTDVLGLVSTIVALGPVLLGDVVGLVTDSLIAPLDTAGVAIAALTAPVVTALSAVVSGLPSVLSLMVNVQPDQPGAPPGPGTEAPSETTSGEFSVSALRIGLLDDVAPDGGVAYVEFATSTAGPNGLPTGP